MVNKLSASSKVSFWTRLATGLTFLAIIFPCIIFGSWAYFIMCFFVAIVAIHEILRAPGPYRFNLPTKIVVYAFALSFTFWSFIKGWIGDPSSNPFTSGTFAMDGFFVSITAIFIYALALFLIAIIDPKFTLSDVTYLFTMGLIVGLGVLGMCFVRFYPTSPGLTQNASSVIALSTGESVTYGNYFASYYSSLDYNQNMSSCLLMFYVLIDTWGSDVGAYVGGMLFGKHKMNPRISPHKTWEGYFLGVLFTTALTLGFTAIMEFGYQLPLVPGILQLGHSQLLESMHVLGGNSWILLVLLTVLLPFTGNIGGFLFSLVKRQYGIKDFGKILPGHGGIIDRFDSVLINSVIVGIVVLITSNGWSFAV